ncbi:MAG: hypothetical protein C0594_07865 [Marinilabiliales bacterium]|mgnify:CR=1 FL=1|nr:MAG: hypothetical protein C0594_07865 [Marinilabiliales bacterium]
MIFEYENTLRRIIFHLLGSSDETDYKVSPDRIEKWKEKRETETKKQKGILAENRLLYFSDFYDLNTIINKNWELFKPLLHDKKRFEIFFSEVEKIRNTIAHGRSILHSQECLLTGILHDLKNMITIYHNKNEMKEDYFVQIVRVTDSLGNEWADNQGMLNNKPILHVGDNYEIIIEAHDPRNRKIKYSVSDINGFKIEQEESHFNINISKELISQHQIIIVEAKTDEPEYENRDSIHFAITVLPAK